MKRNEVISTINRIVGRNAYIQQPGDRVTQEMMPGGDIVTRWDTKARKATHRQYMKKDGTPGRQTMILMQPDE